MVAKIELRESSFDLCLRQMIAAFGQQLEIVFIRLMTSLALIDYQLEDVFVKEGPFLDLFGLLYLYEQYFTEFCFFLEMDQSSYEEMHVFAS